MTNKTKSREELQEYWKNPNDGKNLPEHYIQKPERSIFLSKYIKKYVEKSAKILEPGCNVGRNLKYLLNEGFNNLTGIEISDTAVKTMNEIYPELAQNATIYNLPIEDIIKSFSNNEFDIIFTMAVLEHIPTESEWIFDEIIRITKSYLITIEDEGSESWRHFPRNYKDIFESKSLKQIEESNCSEAKLPSTFVLRIFQK